MERMYKEYMELHIEFEDIEPRTWLGNPDSCKI